MAAITVQVGDDLYALDLSDQEALLGYVAAVQFLSLRQQGIDSDLADLMQRVAADEVITIDMEAGPTVADDGETLAALAALVEAGVLTEDEYEAKRTALEG